MKYRASHGRRARGSKRSFGKQKRSFGRIIIQRRVNIYRPQLKTRAALQFRSPSREFLHNRVPKPDNIYTIIEPATSAHDNARALWKCVNAVLWSFSPFVRLRFAFKPLPFFFLPPLFVLQSSALFLWTFRSMKDIVCHFRALYLSILARSSR